MNFALVLRVFQQEFPGVCSVESHVGNAIGLGRSFGVFDRTFHDVHPNDRGSGSLGNELPHGPSSTKQVHDHLIGTLVDSLKCEGHHLGVQPLCRLWIGLEKRTHADAKRESMKFFVDDFVAVDDFGLSFPSLNTFTHVVVDGMQNAFDPIPPEIQQELDESLAIQWAV